MRQSNAARGCVELVEVAMQRRRVTALVVLGVFLALSRFLVIPTSPVPTWLYRLLTADQAAMCDCGALGLQCCL